MHSERSTTSLEHDPLFQRPRQPPEDLSHTPESLELRHSRLDAMHEHFLLSYPEVISNSLYHPYQLDTIDGIAACVGTRLQENATSINAACVSATGSGKTVTALTAAQMFGLGKEVQGKRMRGLWIAPENHLFENVHKAMRLLDSEASVSNWSDRHHDTSGDLITISTNGLTREIQKYMRGQPSEIPFEDIDITIVDEAHTAIGELASEAFKKLQLGRFNLALTATPVLGNGKTIFETWKDIVAYMDLRQAVEVYGLTGNKRPLTFYTLSPRETLSIDSLDAHGEIKTRDMNRLLNYETMKQFAEQLAVLFTSYNYKTIFYTPRGNYSYFARDMAARLQDRFNVTEEVDANNEPQITAKAIGRFDPKGSKELLANFSNDGTDIILSSHMAEMGWDPDNLNVVVCLAPTFSPASALQRIGRLMHNQKTDTPLIVVFVYYDIFNKATQTYVKQMTQYDLFGLPLNRKAQLVPKDNPTAYNAPLSNVIDLSTFGHPADVYNDQRPDLTQYVTDFRPENPRQPVARPASTPTTRSQTPLHDLPPSLQSKLTNLIAQNPLVMRSEQHLTPGKYVNEPANNECSLVELGKISGVDPTYLAKILRQEKQAVRSRLIEGQRLQYSNEEGVNALDEVIADRDHYSAYRISGILKVPRSAVVHALHSLADNDSTIDYTLRYDREPQTGNKNIAAKQRQYNKDTLYRIGALTARRKIERFTDEVPLPKIVAACGRDPVSVQKHLAEHYGAQPIKRAVRGTSHTVNCYTLTPDQLAEAIDNLKLPPELPGAGYINSSQISSQHLRNLGFSRQDIEAILEAIKFPHYEFSMAGNKSAVFIKTAMLTGFVDYVKECHAQGKLQGSLPPRSKKAVSGGAPPASPIKRRISLDDDSWRQVDRPNPLSRFMVRDPHRFEHLPHVNLPGYVLVESLAERKDQAIDALLAIHQHHTRIQSAIGLNKDNQPVISQAAAQAIKSILKNYKVPRIPQSWRFIDELAKEQALELDKLTSFLTNKQFGSKHVQVISIPKLLSKDLVFCSPSIVARLVDRQSSQT